MNSNSSSKKLEDILLELKFASADDVWAATIMSNRQNIPFETILVNDKIITPEQLKAALKFKYGKEFITQEQISSINSEILSVLPEDFIKMYKVIPVSHDGKNFVVAMVNPDDKKAINNIIVFAGMTPKILIITPYEFDELVNKLF